MTADWKRKIDELWQHIGNQKFYTAENDAAFKKLFVDNPNLLKQFISDILHIPMEEIRDMVILNPEFPPDEPVGKGCRLDISITVKDRKINIEMQAAKEDDFGDRTLFYWAELHISGIEKGTEYGDVPQTIAVNILGFKHFEWKKYHSCFSVMENEKHVPLTNKLEIHFFEIPKLIESTKNNITEHKQMSSEELWLRMLGAKRKEDFEMIASADNAYVNESIVQLLTMNTDEKFRDHMRERDKWERDYLASMSKAARKGREEGLVQGEAIGIEKGKAKGKAEATEEFRASLKEEGLDDSTIEKILSRMKK